MTTQTPSPRTPYSASFSIVAGTTTSGTITTGLKNQQGVLRSVRGSTTSSATSTALAVRVGEASGFGISSIDEVYANTGNDISTTPASFNNSNATLEMDVTTDASGNLYWRVDTSPSGSAAGELRFIFMWG